MLTWLIEQNIQTVIHKTKSKVASNPEDDNQIEETKKYTIKTKKHSKIKRTIKIIILLILITIIVVAIASMQ